MNDTVLSVSTDSLGQGDAELGKRLCGNFFRLLAEEETVPAAAFFVNSGVRLTCSDSPILADLKKLQARGTEVLSCQTCVQHYGLEGQVQVGLVVGMSEFIALARKHPVLTLG